MTTTTDIQSFGVRWAKLLRGLTISKSRESDALAQSQGPRDTLESGTPSCGRQVLVDSRIMLHWNRVRVVATISTQRLRLRAARGGPVT
jgi:hypothetical protein